LLRHFTRDGENWRIKDDLKRMVTFRTWNLIDDLYPLGRFDVMLCRNVLIGFDQQTKLEVLQKLGRILTDDGVLYVGVEESVTGVSGSFTPVIPNLGIYSAAHSMAVARAG
jgi:chemotaxis protein methyltransferase CheR